MILCKLKLFVRYELNFLVKSNIMEVGQKSDITDIFPVWKRM